MNKIELNAILFFADYLSLKEESIPVTQPCKYFFVHSCPINSAFIADVLPDVDVSNKYYKRAAYQYTLIKNKFGEDGVKSFIDGLCNIQSAGMIDAERMLKYIHRYSTKSERKQALKTYENYVDCLTYFHDTINEQGDPQRTQCTRYVEHAEKVLKQRGLLKSVGNDGKTSEKQAD